MDDEDSRLQWNPSYEVLKAYSVQNLRFYDWTSASHGTAGDVLTSQAGSAWTWTDPKTLVEQASGSANEVQYSDGSGGFNSESPFQYNPGNNTLSVDKIVSAFEVNSYGNDITLVSGHAGKVTVITSNNKFITVNGNFEVGQAATLVNGYTNDLTVEQGSNVLLYLAGTSTTGNRTLGPKGTMTILLYRRLNNIDYYTCSGTAIS